MKEIYYTKLFLRHFKSRVSKKRKLVKLYKSALLIFIKNPEHPDLRNHFLRKEMKGFRSFSIDDDCRIIYEETEDKFRFYDIGNHDEVYKKKRIRK